PPVAPSGPETYTVNVNGESYVVEVDAGGEITHYENAAVGSAPSAPVAPAPVGAGEAVTAPLAGTIWKVEVNAGQAVQQGDVLLILEAMKMETQIVAEKNGVVASVSVKPGDTVQVGDHLVAIA
ncbi:MAG: biotin/lipoyl-binding protein, partial [Piscirickettsiaceae bacterium]|nr:biotin/lipoyl-binding protein [Piscirickettsiaceae bacterium]